MSGASGIGGAGAIGAAPKPDERAQLRQLAHQLEGVFLNQLMQAMRASVPHDGLLGDAPGEQMFTQLMDERISAQAADRMERGLGEALYRQLVKGLPPTDGTEAR